MALGDKFKDEAVNNNIETQPCENNIKEGVFLSDDKNVIEALDKFSRSPFDEDWEEIESEQFPGELEHETMPAGIPLEALMAYVDQVSQDDSFDPKIRLIAEEIKGHDKLQEAIRNHFDPDGGENTEDFLNFMLAFIPANERPEDAGLTYKGIKSKYNKYHYKIDFQLTRTQVHGIQDFNSIDGAIDQQDEIKILLGYKNVMLSHVDYKNKKRTITITPKLIIKGLELGKDKKDKITEKDYNELASDLVSFIISEIKEQEVKEKIELGKSIVVDIAFLLTGIGGVLTLAKNGARALPLIAEGFNIIYTTNELIEDTSALWGYNNDKGYNVLLNSMKYLDSKTGETKGFVTTYHAMNMFMCFGKKVKTQVITSGVSTSLGTAISVSSITGEPEIIDINK